MPFPAPADRDKNYTAIGVIPQYRRYSWEQAWHGVLTLTVILTIKNLIMLRWSVIFLVIALVAALFGFTGIAAGAASIAKILFFIFLVLFVLAILGGAFLVKKK